jgi:cytochrome c oxidase accessory protein FixG
MREQVCLYMCPWPRIQAALTDEHALNVTYRYDRGEPRGSFKKGEQLRAAGKPAGDCIDCMQCVNVCPTGVDIRDGANLGCIQCGLCIDACDNVMARLGRPTRLIAYDTEENVQRREAGKRPVYRPIRARTIIYAAVIALVGAIMVYALATREVAGVSVIHDRNPMYVRLADGAVRNAFTVRILNKSLEEREFRLAFTGVTVASFEVIGEANGPAGNHEITVGPDQTREVRVLVTSYQYVPAEGAIPLLFTIIDTRSGLRATATDFFRGPQG